MKNFSLKLTASLILHTELLCLVGLILFTNGHIPVRLVNPNSSLSSPYAGRLEVRWYYSSDFGWGTVCYDHFTYAAARVVCYSLGFGRAGSFGRNRYGSGSGRIWLSDVRCNGGETGINNCSHSLWGYSNCRESNDVSIECAVKDCIGDESECDLVSTACIIINGRKTCSCKKGFVYFNGTTCIDLDECSYPPSGCTTAAGICVNTIGSYTCSCRDGYTQTTSTVCSDIDECSSGQSECNTTTGRCINTDGSYNCSCNSGYRNIKSTICTDLDECVSNESDCDLKSTNCINTVGNYTCHCKNGFTYLNETTCLVGLIEESSQERFGLGAIVGTCVGAFLVVAAVAILILLFCWKRRSEANQPPQRQSSQVDNGPGVENYYGNPIVYMELDQTALGMGRKTTKNAQIEASTRLPVPAEETKATAQSPVFGNVQSSIYATVVSSVDVNAQSAIYENVQE